MATISRSYEGKRDKIVPKEEALKYIEDQSFPVCTVHYRGIHRGILKNFVEKSDQWTEDYIVDVATDLIIKSARELNKGNFIKAQAIAEIAIGVLHFTYFYLTREYGLIDNGSLSSLNRLVAIYQSMSMIDILGQALSKKVCASGVCDLRFTCKSFLVAYFYEWGRDRTPYVCDNKESPTWGSPMSHVSPAGKNDIKAPEMWMGLASMEITHFS